MKRKSKQSLIARQGLEQLKVFREINTAIRAEITLKQAHLISISADGTEQEILPDQANSILTSYYREQWDIQLPLYSERLTVYKSQLVMNTMQTIRKPGISFDEILEIIASMLYRERLALGPVIGNSFTYNDMKYVIKTKSEKLYVRKLAKQLNIQSARFPNLDGEVSTTLDKTYDAIQYHTEDQADLLLKQFMSDLVVKLTKTGFAGSKITPDVENSVTLSVMGKDILKIVSTTELVESLVDTKSSVEQSLKNTLKLYIVTTAK